MIERWRNSKILYESIPESQKWNFDFSSEKRNIKMTTQEMLD